MSKSIISFFFMLGITLSSNAGTTTTVRYNLSKVSGTKAVSVACGPVGDRTASGSGQYQLAITGAIKTAALNAISSGGYVNVVAQPWTFTYTTSKASATTWVSGSVGTYTEYSTYEDSESEKESSTDTDAEEKYTLNYSQIMASPTATVSWMGGVQAICNLPSSGSASSGLYATPYLEVATYYP